MYEAFLLPPEWIGDRIQYRGTVIGAGEPPSYFRYGRGAAVANSVNGWPFDGIVFWDMIPSSVIPFQELREYGVQNPRVFKRHANGAGWSDWQHVSGFQQFYATAASGFSMPSGGAVTAGLRARVEGNRVFVNGLVNMTAPAALTAGQLLATLPAGPSPAFEPVWPEYIIRVYNGGDPAVDGSWETLRGRINANGEVRCSQAGALTASAIYVKTWYPLS